MTFTYEGNLSTDLDKTRFYVQDTVEDSGPKPGGSNFTDEEIEGVDDITGSWQRTVYALFQTLAAIWTHYVDITIGPRRESLSQVAKSYRDQAKAWAKEHNIMPGIQVAGVIRVDGYSDDITSDDVDTGLEYSRVKLLWTEHTT